MQEFGDKNAHKGKKTGMECKILASSAGTHKSLNTQQETFVARRQLESCLSLRERIVYSLKIILSFNKIKIHSQK